jgi:hypothetical protein
MCWMPVFTGMTILYPARGGQKMPGIKANRIQDIT